MNRNPVMIAATTAALLLLAGRPSGAARLDAVSAPSLSVRVPTVTATSAVVEYYKDKYDYGTRTLCYDPAPAAPRNNCVTKTASGNQGSFNVTGLKPATQYNFRIEAIDTREGEKPYNTTGSFATPSPTSIPTRPGLPAGRQGAPRFDAAGRAMPAGPAAAAPAFTLPGKGR